MSGWPYRTDWLPRISSSSGVSPTQYLVYFVVLMLKKGTIYSSVAISQLVFGRGFYGCVGSLELQGIGRTNSYGQLPTRVSLSALSQGRLRGVLLSTTCGVIGIEEFRRTTMLRLTLSFASFVMMSDFVFLVFRRLLIVLQTDQCVRDGPSPLIFYLMVGWLLDL